MPGPQTQRTLHKLLGVPETAETLGITERQLRNLVYLRKIPYCKVGRLLRFDPRELADWVEATTYRPGGAA